MRVFDTDQINLKMRLEYLIGIMWKVSFIAKKYADKKGKFIRTGKVRVL